eukprot:1172737-Prorocentrum_minimum.AAC.1
MNQVPGYSDNERCEWGPALVGAIRRVNETPNEKRGWQPQSGLGSSSSREDGASKKDNVETPVERAGRHQEVFKTLNRMLPKRQKEYRSRMIKASQRRSGAWLLKVGMSVLGRNPKVGKKEGNKLKPGKKALYKYSGTISEIAGSHSCAVRWGASGGPKGEEEGE